MMNEGGCRSGNTGPSLRNLTEIWPFPVNLGGGGNAASFGMGRLGDSRDVFVDNRDHVAVDDPMVVDRRGNGDRSKKRREDDDSSKGVSTSSRSNGNSMLDGDGKRLKTLALENENLESKPEAEISSGKRAEKSVKPSEPPKQDYIHVRARRGQATDSHSLAERARREKISERMIFKILSLAVIRLLGKRWSLMR